MNDKLIKLKIFLEDDGYHLEEDRESGLSGQNIDNLADLLAVIENILVKNPIGGQSNETRKTMVTL
jgi:hypothetical protein